MMNADARSLQERYVEYADEYREMLIEVLHESAIQRDLAATVLAYASDKKAIVPHLEMTVLDSNAEVRNNAMRALGLIAQYAVDHPAGDRVGRDCLCRHAQLGRLRRPQQSVLCSTRID
jgi:hypothetical protein